MEKGSFKLFSDTEFQKWAKDCSVPPSPASLGHQKRWLLALGRRDKKLSNLGSLGWGMGGWRVGGGEGVWKARLGSRRGGSLQWPKDLDSCKEGQGTNGRTVPTLSPPPPLIPLPLPSGSCFLSISSLVSHLPPQVLPWSGVVGPAPVLSL